jgi:two-component system KDP operon response regulator KdpE
MGETAALQDIDRSVSARPKILVVEDEQEMMEILLENLASAGYEVVVARDGVQAWQLFEQEKPDLVTLDLNIPKMSGFRLIQLLKQGNVRVVVVTGMDYEEAEEVAKAGADDFITKPFDPLELVDKVEAVLARRG